MASPEPAFKPYNRQKKCRYGEMVYNIHDTYVGRSFELYGEYSEGEVELFRQVVRADEVVVEVGANIGAHTVFLAQQVGRGGRVWAFEPQRLVFQMLCANLALNQLTNVFALQQAVSDKPGSILVPTMNIHEDNNFGGLSLGTFKFGESVPVVTLDSLNLPRCDFLKVDVEGMEKQVLQGATGLIARARPVIYVENDIDEKSDDLVRYIDSIDYSMYWHKPPYFNKENFQGNSNNVFQGIGSYNMLCVHKSLPHQMHGMKRVDVPPPAGAG